MSNKYQEALDCINTDDENFCNAVRNFYKEYGITPYKVLQGLIDKETPVKVVKWDCAKPETRCAECGAGLERKHDYCWYCGQHIDWGEYE